jgi:tol-pal system protein YbgF
VPFNQTRRTGGFFGHLPGSGVKTTSKSFRRDNKSYFSGTIMNKSLMKSVVLVNLVCLMFLAGCATENQVTSLDTRLNELEVRNAETKDSNEALKSDLAVREEDEQALRHQSASLRAKVEALNDEIRALNGRIEELEHRLNRQKQTEAKGIKADEEQVAKLAKSTKTNDERIYQIEQYLNFEPSAQKAPEKKPGEKTTAKIIPAGQAQNGLSEDEIYRMAKQAFDQGDSDAARKKFQELIEKFPKSERADNAQFWIGEIYYREKWYEKAILEYQKVIENYPKGNKVPASLLKQGLAFLNLGDKTNSRLILEELIKKHPKSNEAKIAKDKVKSLK